MISIIIPVFNGEKFISKCLDQVIAQTYTNIEIIVINDGSTDRTEKILESYKKRDNRIKVYNFNNHGVSWSRNYGIAHMNGDYFTFIDCDDYIETNYIKTLYSYMNQFDNIEAVYCGIGVLDENLNLIRKQEINNGIYTSDEIMKQLLSFDKLNTGPCGKLFSKSLLSKNVLFSDLKIYEDLIFNIDILQNINYVFFTNETYYGYIHQKGIGAMQEFQKKPSTDVIRAMDYSIRICNICDNFDFLFYRIISQVMMYAVNCNIRTDKSFIYETKRFLRKNIKYLKKNKSIPKKEKLIFMIYMYSFRVFSLYRRMKK